MPSTSFSKGTTIPSTWLNDVNSLVYLSVGAGSFLQSNGTSVAASTYALPTTIGTVGKFLRSDGTNIISSSFTFPTTAGTAGKIFRSDGTNILSSSFTIPDTYVVGDLLQASTTSVLSTLAAAATGNALISGGVGTVSSWGKIGLTTHISGTLPVGNGGTGLTTIGTDGYPLVPVSGSTAYASLPPALGYNLVGGYLDWVIGGNQLTCAVKTWAGNNPSAAEPVWYAVRDVTAVTGSLTYRKLTSSLFVNINNTALIGTVNSVAFRLWAVIFNDGGTDRLAIINCLSTSANAGAGRDVTAIYPLAGWGIASAVLSDNAADNAQVFYANAAITSKAYTTLGYATWESGLASAGVWGIDPTRKQLFGPGVALPGQVIQMQCTVSGALIATAGTAVPIDDTIPQNTEGEQLYTQAITPSSAANILEVEGTIGVWSASSDNRNVQSIYQDTTANALATTMQRTDAANNGQGPHMVRARLLSGTTSSTTFKTRAGTGTTVGLTINGQNGGRLFGGVASSGISIREIMA